MKSEGDNSQRESKGKGLYTASSHPFSKHCLAPVYDPTGPPRNEVAKPRNLALGSSSATD